jgi:hypothetical protein
MPARADSLRHAVHRRILARRVALKDSRVRTDMRADTRAPALLLSPHWDDAVLDCWSLLRSDRELNVVNVFAGSPSPGHVTLWDSITGATDSAMRTRERMAEDATALTRANRKPMNLPFLDNQYRTRAGPTLEQLDRALSAHVPSASRVYVPAGLGGHTDHLLVRRYGRVLLHAGLPVTLYADLPYCVLHGWPHWVDGSEPEPCLNVDAFWMSFLASVPEMPPLRSAEVEHLYESMASDKLAAMRCYHTQFTALNGGAKRQLLTDPAIHGYELRWDLVPSR